MSATSEDECQFLLDDSDDEYGLVAVICVTPRATAVVRERMQWQDHASKLCAEDKFARTYRMPPPVYSKLLDILRPDLTVNEEMSQRQMNADSISAEIMLHCLARWLVGGSGCCCYSLVGNGDENGGDDC